MKENVSAVAMSVLIYCVTSEKEANSTVSMSINGVL